MQKIYSIIMDLECYVNKPPIDMKSLGAYHRLLDSLCEYDEDDDIVAEIYTIGTEDKNAVLLMKEAINRIKTSWIIAKPRNKKRFSEKKNTLMDSFFMYKNPSKEDGHDGPLFLKEQELSDEDVDYYLSKIHIDDELAKNTEGLKELIRVCYRGMEREALNDISRLADRVNSFISISDTAIKQFLSDNPDFNLLSDLDNDFKFADIIDIIWEMFHGKVFKEDVSKAMLLRTFNLQGPIDSIIEGKSSIAAVIVHTVREYYKADNAFMEMWERKVPNLLGIKYYLNHKLDYKNNTIAEQWKDDIKTLIDYIQRLNSIKY